MGGDVKLWKPRERCHLPPPPPECGTPSLSLSESHFVREAGRRRAGSGWTPWAKTTGREHDSRTASCPRCPGHPCRDFSISSKRERAEQAQPPRRPRGAFSSMRLNLVLTSSAGWRGPLPLEKEERGLVGRQQEPKFPSALGRQGAGRPARQASRHTPAHTLLSRETRCSRILNDATKSCVRSPCT